MTTKLDELLNEIENLSPEEFRILEEKVKRGYRQKTSSTNMSNKSANEKDNREAIPGTRRPTKEEVEAHLARIFTPEQLAEIARTDVSNIILPPGVKTTAEILDEDREDHR